MPRPYWTLKRALSALGLPETFELKTEQDYDHAMDVWKELTVIARRANEDDKAATLSLVKTVVQKAWLRKKSKKCPRCGKAKRESSQYCGMCSHYVRNYSDKLDMKDESENPLHEMEVALMVIPEMGRPTGPLTQALKKMSEGQIGDSFLTNRTSSSSVSGMAKEMGGQVITRKVATQDPKKPLYRVWRSDGKTMEEVNEIIRKRLAGEDMPKPPKWVPPPPEELKKIQEEEATRAPRRPGRPKASTTAEVLGT